MFVPDRPVPITKIGFRVRRSASCLSFESKLTLYLQRPSERNVRHAILAYCSELL